MPDDLSKMDLDLFKDEHTGGTSKGEVGDDSELTVSRRPHSAKTSTVSKLGFFR